MIFSYCFWFLCLDVKVETYMPIEKNFLLDRLLVNYDSDGISSSPIASHLDTESEKQFSDS